MIEVAGSAVALGGRGLLITGRPGSGKSTLALELVALGARLVADDVVLLGEEAGSLTMAAPPRLAGLIEARGIGILRLPHGPAPLRLVADLDRAEPERVPPPRARDLLGHAVPLVWAGDPAGQGAGRAARLAAALRADAILGPEFRPE